MSVPILMVTWDGAGNIPPALALARHLVRAGHRVHVLAHDSLAQKVKNAGAEFVPIVSAPQLDSRNDLSIDDFLGNVLLSDGLLTDVDSAIDHLEPAVTIVDSMMLLPVAMSKGKGVRTAAFHHTLGSFLFDGSYDEVTYSLNEPINVLLTKRGLPAHDRPLDILRQADAILSATYAEFDDPGPAGAGTYVYVGPAKASPAGHDATLPERAFPDRPYVVVSLSTSFMDQTKLLQKLIDAMNRLAVEALITTGYSVSPSALRSAGNVNVVEFVSHALVLPTTDLLITHAGHGTVLAGATAGTPMLCLPMGRDQHLVAARAAELGLARIADPQSSVDELSGAISQALEDASMAARARAFAARVETHPGMEAGVQCVERLIGSAV